MCVVLSLAVLLNIRVRSRKSRRWPMNSTGHHPIFFSFLSFNLRSAASDRRCRCFDLRVSARLLHGTVKTMEFFFSFFGVYFQVIIPPLTNHTTSRVFSSFVERLFAFPFCKYFLVLFPPSSLGAIFVAIKYKAIVLLEICSRFWDGFIQSPSQ